MPYIGKQPANVPVTADDIPNDSITAAKIVDAAITIDDIGPNAVGNSEMADDAIGLNELSASGTTNSSTFLRGDNSWAVPPNTVYTHPNHSGDVTSSADGATTIASNAVTTAKIADDAITAAKIANDAINHGDLIADGVIKSEHYEDGSIDTAHIADDQVTAAKLANSINTDIATGVTANTTANAALPKAGGTMTGNIAHAGNFTLDVGGNITLDADNGFLKFADGGTDIAQFSKGSNSNLEIKSLVSDADIVFQGNDGGSAISALTLDMSSQGDASFNRHVKLADNGQLVLGDGSDLLIYHDGSHSYISDVGTGDLTIRASNDLRLQSASTEAYLTCNENAGVEIYHNNVKKLETTSTGATVTGYLNVSQTGNASGLQVATSVAAETTAIFQGGGTGAVDVVDVRDSGGNSKFKVRQNGNVGIGASNPSTPLYITKSTNDISGAKLTLNNPHTGNGDYGSTIAFHAGTGGSGTTDTNIGNITCYKKDNTNGSKMRFQIQQGNFSGIDTVLTIDDDGRMHGGSYTFETGHLNLIGEYGASYKAMTFSRTNGGGVVGHITANSSSTTYSTSSDYRLKENVDYTWNATTRLKQLKPARFNWIKDDTNTLVDGFLAHEVSSIVPEAITGEKDAMKDEQYIITPAVEEVQDEDGNITTEAKEAVIGTRNVPDYQGIDQSKLVPLLVKTIQELEARITALEA